MKGGKLISLLAALALAAQPAAAAVHTVQKGESYWLIAKKYGVSLEELLRANGADESSVLNIGDRVTIPGGERVHVVSKGDTYWLIAQWYGVPLEELLRANGADEGSVLNIGDRVIIPGGEKVHVASKGDTYWLISRWYGVSLEELLEANGADESSVLNIGDRVIIPSSPASQPEIETPAPNVPDRGNGPYVTYTTYTVKSGDTLWNIAIECGIPFDELLRENGLNENSTVRDGTVLRVPVHNVPVKYAPEGYGELLDWWTEAQYVVPIGAVFTVTDLATGKSFTAKRTIGSNHADCETLTAADTAKLKEIWGGSFNWGKRAVIITYNGRKIAASAAGMFHAGNEWAPGGVWTDWRSDDYGPGINYDYVKGNDASGHFDIHFYGSTRHNNGAADSGHQANVLKAAGY